jgi:ring-1,2-phenylacetyl-CoA epoxidase subunit PaaE
MRTSGRRERRAKRRCWRRAPDRIHIGVSASRPGGRVAPRRPATRPSAVTIIRDGWRGSPFARAPSILDAASAAGLEVPFSCTSGVCGTCRAKLVEGQVRMERNFALDKAEVASGFVLTCQAHPLTERVVLSFDER